MAAASSRTARGLAAFLALSPGVGRLLAADSAPTPYTRAVERYADGDRSGACEQAQGQDSRYLPAEARSLAGRLRLASDDRKRNALVKAAAMLHMDLAIGARARGDPSGLDNHLELALLYVGIADSFPADAGLRSFARRFYLAAALDRLRHLEAEGAGALAELGVKRFPTDAELRLAKGSVEETSGTWPLAPSSSEGERRGVAALPDRESAGGLSQATSPGRGRKGPLQQAEKEYRAALATDATLVEARLRRGRVLSLLGQKAEAETELDTVLRDGRDPALRYLGFLFQGRLRESGGDLAGAADAYRSASALLRDAQTPHVALGRVLERLGDPRGSREELDRAVSKGRRLLEALDPWWTYPYGQASRADALLAELRTEARR